MGRAPPRPTRRIQPHRRRAPESDESQHSISPIQQLHPTEPRDFPGARAVTHLRQEDTITVIEQKDAAAVADIQDVDLSTLVRNIADEGFKPLDKVGLKGQKDEGMICNLISRDLSHSIDLNVSWSKVLPGQHHLCHHHPDASEFIVIIKGSPLMHLGDKTFRAKPGDGIYVPHNVIHGITNDTEYASEMIVGLSKPADWQFIFDE